MVIRKASPNTDQEARSLLQKAVRRGDAAIAKATFCYLVSERDEFDWLRSRLAVMTFEESWPYGANVTFGRSEAEIISHYAALSACAKNKDAAGLGSLAYGLSEGDESVLTGDPDDWYIRVIAKAIKERDKFREWITGQIPPLSPKQASLIERALDGSKKAGWPWDKAFAYSAAMLALKQPVPALLRFEANMEAEFPFWTAIDKHTQRGKEVIRQVAKQSGVPANTALWLSFYCESAFCTHLLKSPWWERERKWRLSKFGLSEDRAEAEWARLRPAIIDHLQDDAGRLKERIAKFLNPRSCLDTDSPSIVKAQQELF